jgi:hypothetical protein
MARLTINEIIELGDVSTYLSANYQDAGKIFGGRLAETAPQSIALVTDALRWEQESFPDIPEVRATGTITIDSTGDTGDTLTVFVNDPNLGVITLGTYVLTDADTNTTLIAANAAIALAANSYGYGVFSIGSVIYIVAAQGTGAAINGGNNLYCVITTPGFISTEVPERIITQTSLNLIIE